MEVTFYNLLISIAGVGGPKEAYDRLCNALTTIEDKGRIVEWHSDTYQVEEGEKRDTLEIIPSTEEEEAALLVRKD